jgi:hypothetical protein
MWRTEVKELIPNIKKGALLTELINGALSNDPMTGTRRRKLMAIGNKPLKKRRKQITIYFKTQGSRQPLATVVRARKILEITGAANYIVV